MLFKASLILCLVGFAAADLRMASQPKHGYRLTNQGTVKWNIKPWHGQFHYKYMEPSTFGYKGLEHQKARNYDNFLRSNIDNEQDNRNFNEEAGKDHLPFRTYEVEVNDTYYRDHYHHHGVLQAPQLIDTFKVMKPGESMLVPLRWNNPHSSEMEVNIWIFEHGVNKQPIVVPIRKPSCSGEGYQDNIISFTVPEDFKDLGAKIPGFKGCNEDSSPQCTLQIYSHSVESRTYALGFPIVITDHDTSKTTSDASGIKKVSEDPWLEIGDLRDICLPATDPSATITSSVPKWARLVSDVFNHAYQNSDYSPYSGQQHELISKNLQASAINKMETGNRGELGKSILTHDLRRKLHELHRLEDRVYKNYEALANKIIKDVGNSMKNTGKVGVTGRLQQLATCFRCAESGSTNTKRQETNTYIPSFQLSTDLIDDAREHVPEKYSKLVSDSGLVQIYVSAMNDLLPVFYKYRSIGVIYQDAVVKSSIGTMADATNFTKVDKDGKTDYGKYAATEAKKTLAAMKGCPRHCLQPSARIPGAALLQEIEPHSATGLLQKSQDDDDDNNNDDDAQELKKASEWSPASSISLGAGRRRAWMKSNRPVTLKFDLGDNVWIIGAVEENHLKMAEIKINSASDYTFHGNKYTDARRYPFCTKQETFIAECFDGGRDTNRVAYEPVKAEEDSVIFQRNGLPDKEEKEDEDQTYEYVGCFQHNHVRRPFPDVPSTPAGVKSCRDQCAERGYEFFGFECPHHETEVHCECGDTQGAFAGSPKDLKECAGGPPRHHCKGPFNIVTDFGNYSMGNAHIGSLYRTAPKSLESWYCVASSTNKTVSGPYADLEAAKKVLNKSPGSRSNRQMICQMSELGFKKDPQRVGGQFQAAGEKAGFNTYWHGWHDREQMNYMCLGNDKCAFNGKPAPAANPKSWYCVPNLHKQNVSGPYSTLELAKEKLNEAEGSRSNIQMICEMSVKSEGDLLGKAKGDPHRVGGQYQGGGEASGFNKYWNGWHDIDRMNDMCNKARSCALNDAAADSFEKPLFINSLGTNTSGDCAPCVQFFGKKIHPLSQPDMTPLSTGILSSDDGDESVPKNVAKSDRLADNPDGDEVDLRTSEIIPLQSNPDDTPAMTAPASRRRRRSTRRRRR